MTILWLNNFSQTTEFQKLLADPSINEQQFGYSVAVFENTAVIGANASNSAYIFEKSGGEWIQTDFLMPENSSGNQFGCSVDIYGDYIIIGADEDDENGDNSGAAYIYKKNGDSWTLLNKIMANDGGENDFFGNAVSIYEDFIFVGAYHSGTSGYQGSVYVYHQNNGNWEFYTKLTGTDVSSNANFGYSVDLFDTYAIIGGNNDSAYIFYNNTGTWELHQTLFADDDDGASNQFGYTVAINNNYAVVGAQNPPDTLSFTGAAYVFSNNSDNWQQEAKLTAPNPAQGDKFSKALAIYNDTILVGAPFHNYTTTSTGYVYCFTKDNNSWVNFMNIAASDPFFNSFLGSSIALSENFAIVGAYNARNDSSERSGAAYLFYLSNEPVIISNPHDVWANVDETVNFSITYSNATDFQWQIDDGTGFTNIIDDDIFQNSNTSKLKINGITLDMDLNKFRCIISNDSGSVTSNYATLHVDTNNIPSIIIETQKLTSSNGNAEDFFGYSVDIDNDYLIVGANKMNMTSYAGYATIFKRNSDSWEELKILNPTDTANDGFGYSVSISGDYAFVGAYKDTSDNLECGAVYIFNKNNGGADNWGLVGKLTAEIPQKNEFFGYSIDISGDYAAIGAYGYDTLHQYGTVYVYKNLSGNWTEQTQLFSLTAESNTNFGKAVAINGNYLIVGANNDSAYIFYNNAGNWEYQNTIVADDDDAGQQELFGHSVAINDNFAVVGAIHKPYPDCNGTIYIYQNNSGNWTQLTQIMANDNNEGDIFGNSVAICGDTIIVGAPRNNFNGTASGCAYIFSYQNNSWSQISKMVASDGQPVDRFGYDVAISGHSVLVGARADDAPEINKGSAYVFDNFENPYTIIKNICIKNNFDIFPNPADNYFYINSNINDNYDVDIYDITGKKILQYTNIKSTDKINITDLKSGVYIIRLSSKNIALTKKIIIE